MTTSVLFICLGNICRSPMAEATFRHLANEAGLGSTMVIDSAGTGDWHVGERPHPSTLRVLRDHGIRADGLVARTIAPGDLHTFDYLVVMDGNNLRDVTRMAEHYGHHGRIVRLLDFADPAAVGTTRDVPDPYYDGRFEHVYGLVEAGCQGLLDDVRRLSTA